MLYNLAKRQWDEDLLAIGGISKLNLSELVNPTQEIGPLTSEAARELGLRLGLPVYAGGHDQFCAALGAGVISPGETLLSGGTAWVLLCVVDSLIFDNHNYLAIEEHVIPGLWGILSSIPAAGVSMRWLNSFTGEQGYGVIDNEAGDVSPGSDGLFFLPHLTGAGAPHWESNHQGTILGLRLGHTRGHVSRALMEGVGYEVRWVLECFRDLGTKPKVLKMLGGGSRSSVWPQIIADVAGLEVEIPDVSDAGALGAAILAGLGYGVFASVGSLADLVRPSVLIQPAEPALEKYSQLFSLYKAVFEALSKLYEKIGGIMI
jgi:xylulokinase